MEKDKTFILRLDRSTHGAVSTGCEESVLKDLQKDKNVVACMAVEDIDVISEMFDLVTSPLAERRDSGKSIGSLIGMSFITGRLPGGKKCYSYRSRTDMRSDRRTNPRNLIRGQVVRKDFGRICNKTIHYRLIRITVSQ